MIVRSVESLSLAVRSVVLPLIGVFYAIGHADAHDACWVIELEWGGFGTGVGQFSSPRDVAVDSQGEIYVADDGNSRVQVFTDSGTYLREWSTPEPFGIEIGEESLLPVPGLNDITVYTIPFGQCQVRRYSNTGESLGNWGSCDGEGSLQGARDVGVVGEHAFVVSNLLQQYTVDGTFVGTMDGSTWDSISIAPDGTVWIMFGFNAVVKQYSTDGVQLREWFLAPPGEYHQFGGIAVGEGGSVYVTELIDLIGSAIHEYTLDGELQCTTTFSHLFGTGRVIAVGSATLYVASTGTDTILKLVRGAVPIERTTWGQIKAKYAGENSPSE